MSDSLKQAVEGLEVAWSRLREVLDGPDVAAALAERPMSTAPRDGTPIMLHHVWGDRIQALYHVGYRGWVDRQNNLLREEGEFIGWSIAKQSASDANQLANPMSTAPRDGTCIYLDFGDRRGTPYVRWTGTEWMDERGNAVVRNPIGWWPVK